MKSYRGTRSTTPRILTFCSRWRRVVHCLHWPLYRGKVPKYALNLLPLPVNEPRLLSPPSLSHVTVCVTFCRCCILRCLVCIVVSCLVCIVVSCLVCIVVVVLCVLLSSYVYLLYYVCIAVFTLDAGLLARSQYSEVPATDHLDIGFSWFPCVYKQMLRWFSRFQVATTCFSCSPRDLNLLVTNFIFCVHVK